MNFVANSGFAWLVATLSGLAAALRAPQHQRQAHDFEADESSDSSSVVDIATPTTTTSTTTSVLVDVEADDERPAAPSLQRVVDVDRALTIRFVRSLLLTLVALMRDNAANQRYLRDDITLDLLVDLLRKLAIRDDEQVIFWCLVLQTFQFCFRFAF